MAYHTCRKPRSRLRNSRHVPSTRYAVRTDHLHTPRRLMQTQLITNWQWPYSAFGEEPPTQRKYRFVNPATVNLGETTTAAPLNYNLRFPGQLADAESGLFYNYFRSYDPKTGRYSQFDPIGLNGGPNGYLYAEGNPLTYIDPLGLWAWGDPLPQEVVDVCAGFGDGVSLGVTAGVRGLMGTNDVVDFSSPEYVGGVVAGVAVTTRGYATGAELSIGRNFRFAPWGNRTGNPTGRYPHYHRRGAPDANGNTPPGQGIGRHRPWDKKSTDKCGCDRF
jgi:RHS repeat-associated protein